MSKLDELKHELRNCESGRDVYDVAEDAISELERAMRVVAAARSAVEWGCLARIGDETWSDEGKELEAAVQAFDAGK